MVGVVTTAGVHLMPLNCILKNPRDGQFYVVCVLSQSETLSPALGQGPGSESALLRVSSGPRPLT